MGTKNNPKNRNQVSNAKVYNGKEVEPIMFVDPISGKKYLSAKYAKSNDIITDGSKQPVKWKDILSENK